jgi:hypothetical protein
MGLINCPDKFTHLINTCQNKLVNFGGQTGNVMLGEVRLEYVNDCCQP